MRKVIGHADARRRVERSLAQVDWFVPAYNEVEHHRLMDTPWARVDVTIDETVVKATLADQFPSLASASVRFLHEGWDSRAFIVGDEWVFRFPKRNEVAERLQVEIALLPSIAKAFPLAVPRFQWIGVPSAPYAFPFVGYRILLGDILLRLDLDAVDFRRFGPPLGAALSALHSFDCDAARRFNVRESSSHDDLSDWSSDALQSATNLRDGPHASELAAAIPTLATPPPRYAGAPRLIHADVAAEHLLVDSSFEPIGLIDWGDVQLGDPAQDFGGLYSLAGAPLVDAVLRSYELSVDARFRDRVRFFSACQAVNDLAYGVFDGRPEYVRGALRSLRLHGADSQGT